MKKQLETTTIFLLAFVAFALAAFIPAQVQALPTLQLDIANGVYDPVSKTIVSSADKFTLYAFLLPGKTQAPVTGAYYISAALVATNGKTIGAGNFGSFSFNGVQKNVTNDMVFGTPPLEANLAFDPGDLSKHGIYPTYFNEFSFKFNSNNETAQYNTQDRAKAGTPINIAPNPNNGNMYYAAFSVDTTLLAPGYAIHFDLYNEKVRRGDTDVNLFAPFSHDAQSRAKVPEPATALLIGAGFAGLWLHGKKQKGTSKN
ncbi:MAG: choice-of-anchor N protein [Deltaproteobacteria bacterium]|nr:choice-of-anchor N protein [Deltaproteobacteria bacterium]